MGADGPAGRGRARTGANGSWMRSQWFLGDDVGAGEASRGWWREEKDAWEERVTLINSLLLSTISFNEADRRSASIPSLDASSTRSPSTDDAPLTSPPETDSPVLEDKTDDVWTLVPRYGHAAGGARQARRGPGDQPAESDPDDDCKTVYVPVWLEDAVAHGHYDGYCKQSDDTRFASPPPSRAPTQLVIGLAALSVVVRRSYPAPRLSSHRAFACETPARGYDVHLPLSMKKLSRQHRLLSSLARLREAVLHVLPRAAGGAIPRHVSCCYRAFPTHSYNALHRALEPCLGRSQLAEGLSALVPCALLTVLSVVVWLLSRLALHIARSYSVVQGVLGRCVCDGAVVCPSSLRAVAGSGVFGTELSCVAFRACPCTPFFCAGLLIVLAGASPLHFLSSILW
ncbi:hypothetical protein B0H16DRAFT_1883249 [Mycena metata]|uniref:Uncharacterized protein n=1 Tax=Mycena metata TaxID=1033252 RepID=A0AAD7JIK8_9AGAR|nr:hypothetical protein B0H16DRAFT_1883249 [Mycena metata]